MGHHNSYKAVTEGDIELQMAIDRAAMRSFARDSEWLTRHYEEIKNSGNKVIAIKDGGVIHEGENVEDVLKDLEKQGEDLALILIEVIPPDDAAFIL